MSIDVTTEKRFEEDIEAFFISPAGGYTKGTDTYDPALGLYVNTLIEFIQRTQPKEWARFENQNKVDPVRKFCLALNTACDTEGLVSVLRHGFKHRGITFRVCYFKPESSLNQTAAALYAKNVVNCNRQWYYSADTKKSVDMVLVLNGIPVFAFELKNQYTWTMPSGSGCMTVIPEKSASSSISASWATSALTTPKSGWQPNSLVRTPSFCLSTKALPVQAVTVERATQLTPTAIPRNICGNRFSRKKV